MGKVRPNADHDEAPPFVDRIRSGLRPRCRLWRQSGAADRTDRSTTNSRQLLSINGLPDVLDIGQKVVLTVTVKLPDSAQKQTQEATSESSNPSVATVSPTGQLTVTGYGEAAIRASAYGQSTTVRAFAPPPPKIQLSIRIDQHGSTAGLCDVTNTTFDLSGSSGTSLRYAISFGDGASDATNVSRHVFGCPATRPPYPFTRTYAIRATVTDVLERTDVANANVTVVDRLDRMHTINFQGGWRSTYLSQSVGFRDLSLASQTGLAVTGYYVSSDDPTFSLRPFTGTLTRDNGLEIGLNDGTIHMSGYLIQSEYPFGARIVLTFRGGTADGKTLQFEPYSSY